jgi:glycosyltransferase involved in cell wall biosynthesis
MSLSNQPLVSIVTPFFNTEEFLAECIESVLAQTYSNWEYILVNNCSTDRSFEIALSYAQRDPRIRLVNNDLFLGQVQNYNHALRLMSSESKYCKIVQADDWIFPDCLAEMVGVAEAYPTIGVVSSYLLRGTNVLGNGLPYPSTFVCGSEICKRQLLNHPDQHYFGTATSLLILSSLIRTQDPFYDENIPYFEDYEVWLRVLNKCDYGFVHKVLTFQRVDQRSLSGRIRDFFPNLSVAFICLNKYGNTYLSDKEYQERMQTIKNRYFQELARAVIRNKNGKQIWEYHRDMLRSVDCNINMREFTRYCIREFIEIVRHPRLLCKILFGLVITVKQN